jgi:Zn-dependent alcohol dehydrogenase
LLPAEEFFWLTNAYVELAIMRSRQSIPISGSAIPARDIPLYAEAFMSGRLPVDRLLTGEIDFENLNRGFDDLDDGVGVRQILNCGL